MARFDKKWWLGHVAATTFVVGLVVLCVPGCNKSKDAEEEKEQATSAVNVATEKLNQATAKMDSLFVVNGDLKQDNLAKSDTIREQKKIISAQQDSIVGLNKTVADKDGQLKVVAAELEDCKQNKTVIKKSKPTKKPVVVSRPVVQVVDTVSNPNSSAALVRVNASENSGNIIVNGAPAAVVLDNQSVNSGNIIVGNNNNIQIYGQGEVRVESQSSDTVAARAANDSIVCTVRWKTVVVNTR